MTQDEDILSVWLGDVLVGELRRSGEGSVFTMDDSYHGLAERPVLGQAFEDDPTATYFVRQGVPSWFRNLLPEGPLRELIAQRAGVNPARSWFLLEFLGLDLPGAVVIRRVGEPPDLDFEEVDETYDPNEPLKFSLAGVQLKFSALRDDRGLTIPAHGQGGDWIVKLPDQRFEGVPETEYCVMRWAGDAGIDVPEVLLVSVADVANLPAQFYERGGLAFATRRFDRPGPERVHIEDFAQVLGLTPQEKYGHANYESIARIIAALAPQDIEQFVRRLVFQVLSGNGDAHVKNWSLIYPDGIRPRLSPAYDLMNTTAFMPDDALGLRIGRVKAFDEITLTTFTRFASKAGLDTSTVEATVLDQVDATLTAWATIRGDLIAPKRVVEELDARLSALPLVVNRGAKLA